VVRLTILKCEQGFAFVRRYCTSDCTVRRFLIADSDYCTVLYSTYDLGHLFFRFISFSSITLTVLLFGSGFVIVEMMLRTTHESILGERCRPRPLPTKSKYTVFEQNLKALTTETPIDMKASTLLSVLAAFFFANLIVVDGSPSEDIGLVDNMELPRSGGLRISSGRESAERKLGSGYSYQVFTTSTGGSKIAWRLFECDKDPSVQDPDEKTINFVHAKRYRDGSTSVDLKSGKHYCVRIFKGDGREFGSSSGSNTLSVYAFGKSSWWYTSAGEIHMATVRLNAKGLAVEVKVATSIYSKFDRVYFVT